MMVELDSATKNQLFTTLNDWNTILSDVPQDEEAAPPPSPAPEPW